MNNSETSTKVDYTKFGISGLGGWLVFIQIGLYTTIIGVVVVLFNYSYPALSTETWELLTSKSSEYYNAMWAPLIIFETLYSIGLLIFTLVILTFFYRRKRVLPRLMIIFYSINVFISLINFVLNTQIATIPELESERGSQIRDIVQAIITCAIWIPYFLKSERVKNTFIR